MEYLWLLLPVLSGVAAVSANDSAPSPAPTPDGLEVESLLECLIDPHCSQMMSSAQGAVPSAQSTFVTTTTINGRPVTIDVNNATPTGYIIALHDDLNHTMRCHAGDEPPVTLTCDAPAESTAYHDRITLVGHSSKTNVLLVSGVSVLGGLALLTLIGCCCAARRGRKGKASRTNPTSPTNEVTEIIETTTQTTGTGTLGRTAEEGRSAGPFAGPGAGGAAAEHQRLQSSGMASDTGAGLASRPGPNAGPGQTVGTGQGAGSGQATGGGTPAGAGSAGMDGSGAGTTGIGQGGHAQSGAAQGGIGQGGHTQGGASQGGLGGENGHGVGQSAHSAGAADQTGSEIIDNGSVRGRRVVRSGK